MKISLDTLAHCQLWFNHYFKLFQWIHCIYAACLFKDAGADKSGFFQRLIGLAIQTFGGGIWVGLLLGQPPGSCSNRLVYIQFELLISIRT